MAERVHVRMEEDLMPKLVFRALLEWFLQNSKFLKNEKSFFVHL